MSPEPGDTPSLAGALIPTVRFDATGMVAALTIDTSKIPGGGDYTLEVVAPPKGRILDLQGNQLGYGPYDSPITYPPPGDILYSFFASPSAYLTLDLNVSQTADSRWIETHDEIGAISIPAEPL